MLGVISTPPRWARWGNTPTQSWLSSSAAKPNYQRMERAASSSTMTALDLDPSWSSWDQTCCQKRTSRRLVCWFLSQLCTVPNVSVLRRSMQRRCTTTSDHSSSIWKKALSFLGNWWEDNSSCPGCHITEKTLRSDPQTTLYSSLIFINSNKKLHESDVILSEQGWQGLDVIYSKHPVSKHRPDSSIQYKCEHSNFFQRCKSQRYYFAFLRSWSVLPELRL